MDFGMLSPLLVETPQAELRATVGAVLVGAFVGAFLSGIVTMQTYLYFRIYQKDRMTFKVLVAFIWVLDFLHTVMACAGNWNYLIEHFGDMTRHDHISWTIATTFALTAIVKFIVQSFFIHRIYTVSRGNIWFTAPIGLLAFFRLVIAFVTTAEMIRLGSFASFVKYYSWAFSTGLGTAAAVDILIALGLSYFLRKSRTGFSSMDQIIDSLILYTVESGFLTCATTVASLICWTTMPTNLIFLGLHFSISKLYSNSLLATLNSRIALRGKSHSSGDADHPMPVLFPDTYSRRFTSRRDIEPTNTTVQISVEKTIQHDGDRGSGSLAYDTSGTSPLELDDMDSNSIKNKGVTSLA